MSDVRAIFAESASNCNQNSSPRLSCRDVWGGNNQVNHTIGLPGLVGWVYSNPLEPAAAGGDVHYFSVCSEGILSRFALADVSGHGQCSSFTANRLRELIRKYIDVWDQTALMRDLNEALKRDTPHEQFATAAVFGYYRVTCELVLTNAGHPPPLWYHTDSGSWDWLETTSPFLVSHKDLPLGLIRGTSYLQQAVRLAQHDMLIIYTDGITEARNAKNHFLGQEGLLSVACDLPTGSPSAAAFQLNSALRPFRGSTPVDDDETFVVLQQTGEI